MGETRARAAKWRLIQTERAAGTLEYIAMVMAAVICAVAVIVSAGDGKAFATAYCNAVGKVIEGACSSTPETTPFNPEPEKCKRTETGEKVTTEVNIFFIKLGGNSGFVVTEYSDGSVKMTATNGAGIGVEFSPGAGAKAGGKKGGASVDFGGGLEYGWGSTWNFGSMAEAEAFRKQFDAYRNQWPWENKPAPRPPDETITSIKVNAEVEGELGIGAGKGKVNVEGSGTWTTRTKADPTPDNGKDDTLTTYTTDLSIKGGAEAEALSKSLGVKGMLGSSVSITKDAKGNIVNITFVSTAEGSLKGGQKGKAESTKPKGSASSKGSAEVGKAVVVTTSLDLDPNDPKSQQIVKDWLGGDNPNHANPLDVVSAPFINPTEKVDGDPFQNLLYERAQVSTVEYDKVKDTQGFAAEVKLGVKLGFDFSLEKSEATAVNATYLGAPDPDGVRRPVPYTSCITGTGGGGAGGGGGGGGGGGW